MPHNFKHGWKKKIQQTPVFIVTVRNYTSYVSYSKGGQSHLEVVAQSALDPPQSHSLCCSAVSIGQEG